MKKLLALIVIGVFILGGVAIAQPLISFENLPRGSSVEGLGTVHPDLNISTPSGTAQVVETGLSPPASHGGPNVGTSRTNNCLEDATGQRVNVNDQADPTNPTETAKGFAEIGAVNGRRPHNYTFEFALGVTVDQFSVKVFDFGDLNLSRSTTHEVLLQAFDASERLVDEFAFSYTSDGAINPRSSDFGDLLSAGDACDAGEGDPGVMELKVEGPGITKIRLTFPIGFDQNISLDSVDFPEEVDQADHFLCYKAKSAEGEPKFERRDVDLDDQFGATTKTVKKPKFLCTPVAKDGEPVIDPAGHLVCYEVKGQDKFEKRDVLVFNQFEDAEEGRILTVKKPRILCVPSEKVEVFEVEDDDDGDDDDDDDDGDKHKDRDDDDDNDDDDDD